jgi:hypothetical protein
MVFMAHTATGRFWAEDQHVAQEGKQKHDEDAIGNCLTIDLKELHRIASRFITAGAAFGRCVPYRSRRLLMR